MWELFSYILGYIKEEESGQGMVEYGITVAFVVAIVALMYTKKDPLNSSIKELYSNVVSKIDDVVS